MASKVDVGEPVREVREWFVEGVSELNLEDRFKMDRGT
jgi:hypothetical protein